MCIPYAYLYVQMHFVLCMCCPRSWLHKFPAVIVAQRTQKEKPYPSWTQGTYIFNLLNFTYCINGSWIFNDSLSPTDTAAIILALLLCYVLGVWCLLPAYFHWIAFPCDVKSWDFSKTGMIAETSCSPFSSLKSIGCSFMATEILQVGMALKMQKGWALVVTDQCYFIEELKWKIDPAKCVCIKIMVHVIIMRLKLYI